ncbi:hypothetical protein [Candidatus Protochlamydia phocaeensis]|uniref:hypothetical protein n=1 Tax=Candidatus Protochlamydia phocaeensis TaxID=1414722 RepID=UPI0008399EA2|nr:hypothetical protein [Candidatus Protochlamydia phocaeensis]
MYKDASYKEKFAALADWLPSIIDSVKKDLKNEHLKKDFVFVKKFFPSKNFNKLTNEDLTEAYQKAIAEEEKGEEIAEFVTSRWLIKHGDLYEFFETRLTQINPNFSELEELTSAQAHSLMEEAIREFGAPQTYLFAVLNSVVFPADTFKQLEKRAKQENQQQVEQAQLDAEKMTMDQVKKEFEREIARLTDKYEKKLAGLQKKYLTDVEGLKKQIAQLQRKLHEKAS